MKFVILAVVCLLAGLYLIYEGQRYNSKYDLCHSDYNYHYNFTQESICKSHPFSSTFHALGLINCTKADNHLIEEAPRLCALRNWYMTSWMERLRLVVVTVYDRATSSLMISIIIPLAVVAIIYVYIQDQGTTTRHALSLENQNQPIEAMERLMTKLHTPSASEILVNNNRSHFKRTRSSSHLAQRVDPPVK